MKDHKTIDNIHIDIMTTITTTSHTITSITTTTYKYVDKWTAPGEKKNNKIKKSKKVH